MDFLDKNVLNSMQVLASAIVREPMDKTSLCVDYTKEVIEFEYGNNPEKIIVNCSYDSQAAAVRDFAKQLLMKIEI